MATSWVLGKISDALQPTIQSTVSTAGSFAGGTLNTVGAGINGVGQSINGTIKRYGDGVKDYGNGVMDWTNATGGRAQTASNPLGLSGGVSQGKKSVTSPSVYSATAKPKANVSKTAIPLNKTSQPQKKIQNITAKSVSPAVKKSTSVTTKPTPVIKTVQGAKRSDAAQNAVKSPMRSTASKPSPVKASTTSVNKVKTSSAPKVNHVAAANPLGLK